MWFGTRQVLAGRCICILTGNLMDNVEFNRLKKSEKYFANPPYFGNALSSILIRKYYYFLVIFSGTF